MVAFRCFLLNFLVLFAVFAILYFIRGEKTPCGSADRCRLVLNAWLLLDISTFPHGLKALMDEEGEESEGGGVNREAWSAGSNVSSINRLNLALKEKKNTGNFSSLQKIDDCGCFVGSSPYFAHYSGPQLQSIPSFPTSGL